MVESGHQRHPSHALMTPGEVAALFSVGTKTVRLWADAGRLTAVTTPGGTRRYLRAQVEQLLAERTSDRSDASARLGSVSGT